MLKTKWMLLVDDNPNDAGLALNALALNESGGDVVVARDGVDAMDCLYRRGRFGRREEGNPAVVLLDLKMPKMDGFEVLQRIKADPQLQSIPVVMFTSSWEEVDVAQSYQLGANAFVVKPVVFAQFNDVVEGIKHYWMQVNEPPPTRINGRMPCGAEVEGTG